MEINSLQLLKSLDFDIKDCQSSYTNTNNISVPRVTEILSKMIHRDTLMYWANSLGFKGLRYRDVLNKAAEVGSIAHAAIEKFLKEKLETNDNIPFLGFLLWYNIVSQNTGLHIEPIYVEHKLVCQWFGGTLDALLRIGNKMYLVDFKTSNHITFNYFLQLAAYRYMLLIVDNINIDGAIVLQLDKDEPGFNEYLLNFANPNHFAFISHCEETFLSLVYAYYNVYKAESLYKNIF